MKPGSVSKEGSFLSHANLEYLRHDDTMNFHLLPLVTILKRFHTDPENGLTAERASKALEFYGANRLKKTHQENKLLFFLKNFFGGFSLMLWGSATLCFTAYFLERQKHLGIADKSKNNEHLYVGSVLITVVLITGIFSYYQSKKSSETMASFMKMMPQYATVIRDGRKIIISVEEVVVGDLVELTAGDQVPADLRIVKCSGLKVNNSCLTGESEPQDLDTETREESVIDAKNLAFSSTVVVEGNGRGIVIACGEETQIGRIAELTSGLAGCETPLSREIRRFVKIITVVSIFFGGIFFALAIIVGYTLLEAALFLIAIMVANVPEGLLVTVTMCLTFSARQMARKNCLVKHLEAVEALGSTTVICSDKTGTLTQNSMTVSHMWYDYNELPIDSEVPTKDLDLKNASLIKICRIGMLCNKAEFKGGETDPNPYKRKIIGDASESALLKFTEVVHGEVGEFRRRHRKICEIPFNSTLKYQVSIHETGNIESPYLLVMKGAPERVLELCNRIYTANGIERMNRDIRRDIKGVFTKLAEYGERVLGFCELELNPHVYPLGYAFNSKEVNFPLKRLVFVGLISLIDPPRPGVAQAVANCRSAGIKVIMVTGDHPTTALAIARQVGIVSEGNATPEEVARRLGVPVEHVDPDEAYAIVVHGSELKSMTPRELDEILLTYPDIVFARTTPTQKLNIVQALQRLGAIVAVTGDGVNDSPALKMANIGVAMGIAGSDVAKQAADMILLDDNFATIVVGIEQGRIVFDNLKKSIVYTLTSNTPEMLPFMFTLLFRAPLPLGVMAILCINVGTDLWPAISLAYEEPESDIMQRKPRDPRRDNFVNWRLVSMAYIQIGMMQATGGFFMYFVMMAAYGFLPRDLFGILEKWQSKEIDDLQDSYGQEWSYEHRKRLEFACHTAFFISIMMTQIADVMICKTRRLSLFEKGMNNKVMNYGILSEIIFTLFFVYTPYVNDALNFVPVDLICWFLPIFFALYIIIYDEVRKFWIRRRSVSFIAAETWY